MTARTRLAAITLLLSLAPLAAAEDHAIKLDRVNKAGDKFHIKASVKMEAVNKVTVGGQPVPAPAMNRSLDFEADAVVDAVNEAGRATKVTYSVTSTNGTDGGQPRQFLKPGGVIVATNPTDKDTQYHDGDGAPIDPEAKELLDLTIDIAPAEKSEDEMFGTEKPQAVGGSWPVNADAVKKDIERAGVDTTAAEITGESTLVAARDGGVQVKSDVKVKGIGPGDDKLPPGSAIEAANMQLTRDALYPADTSKPVTDDILTMNMSMKMTLKDPSGQQANVEVEGKVLAKVERTKK